MWKPFEEVLRLFNQAARLCTAGPIRTTHRILHPDCRNDKNLYLRPSSMRKIAEIPRYTLAQAVTENKNVEELALQQRLSLFRRSTSNVRSGSFQNLRPRSKK